MNNSTQTPVRPWHQIGLCGHFDYDDVLAVADRLINWLNDKHCQVIMTTTEDGEEYIVTLTHMPKSQMVSRDSITTFLSQLHAQPTIHFKED